MLSGPPLIGPGLWGVVWLGPDWMPGWGQHAVMNDAGHWRVMDAGAAL